MMSIALRRSSCRLAQKRLIRAALCSVESVSQYHMPAFSGDVLPRNGGRTSCLTAREFHVKSAMLEFKASVASRAESAVEYAYDDKDEGLEISKLGISDDIVSALSRRGIMKLFPIQVIMVS